MIEVSLTLFTFHFIVPVPIDWMLDVDVPLISVNFLNLTFLANFYTNVITYYYYYEVLTNLPICNFATSFKLIF